MWECVWGKVLGMCMEVHRRGERKRERAHVLGAPQGEWFLHRWVQQRDKAEVEGRELVGRSPRLCMRPGPCYATACEQAAGRRALCSGAPGGTLTKYLPSPANAGLTLTMAAAAEKARAVSRACVPRTQLLQLDNAL